MANRISIKDGDLRKSVFTTQTKENRRELSRVDGPLRAATRQRFNSLLAPRQLERFVPKPSRELGPHDAAGRTTSNSREPSAPFVKAPQEAVLVGTVSNLGALVRERRKALGFNQQQLADLSGVGRRFVSELESGKATLEFDRVLQCCKALGLDLLVRPRG